MAATAAATATAHRAPPGGPAKRHRYTASFYREQEGGSHLSALVIVPLVMDILNLLAPTPVRSAVDLGCGVGAWLAALQAHGVSDVLGIDGAHVDQRMLRIPPGDFLAHDLTAPLTLERRFDLAICLEVGEHLPAASAGTLVDTVTGLSPVVLWSAAVSGQGGTHHVNEQWPDYWRALFAARGYELHDVVRPLIWNDPRVEPWYRQNVLLFVRSHHPLADRIRSAPYGCPEMLAVVHPALFSPDDAPIGQLIRRGAQVLWRRAARAPCRAWHLVRRTGPAATE